jgi:hypothetical protein
MPGEKKRSNWTNSVLASNKSPIRISGKKKSKIDLDQTSFSKNSFKLYIFLLTELETPGHNPNRSDIVSAGWLSNEVFEIDRLQSTDTFTFDNNQLVSVKSFNKEGFIQSRKVRIFYEEDPRNTN